MSSLLKLPRELRVIIIDLVIFTTSTVKVPICYDGPSGVKDRRELDTAETLYSQSCQNTDGVKYLPQQPTVNSSSLLLVNQQVRRETLDLLDRSPKTYELDLAYAPGEGVLPTWTLIPALVTRLDGLRISVRIIGKHLDCPPEDINLSLSNPGLGPPPPFVWWFYSILERFLHFGPTGQQGAYKDGRVVVTTLDIDVQDFDYMAWENETIWKFTVSAEDICNISVKYLDELLTMAGGLSIFGALLYARIGSINLSLNGKGIIQWDLAEYFQEMPCTLHRNGSNVFYEWWPETYRKRYAAGLPMADRRGSRFRK